MQFFVLNFAVNSQKITQLQNICVKSIKATEPSCLTNTVPLGQFLFIKTLLGVMALRLVTHTQTEGRPNLLL